VTADEVGEEEAAEAAHDDVVAALEEAEGDLEVAETCAVAVGTKAKAELRTMLDVAYESGVQQGTAAIVAALEASVVDGPQEDHPSRAALQGQANSNVTWTKLRNAWNF